MKKKPSNYIFLNQICYKLYFFPSHCKPADIYILITPIFMLTRVHTPDHTLTKQIPDHTVASQSPPLILPLLLPALEAPYTQSR